MQKINNYEDDYDDDNNDETSCSLFRAVGCRELGAPSCCSSAASRLSVQKINDDEDSDDFCFPCKRSMMMKMMVMMRMNCRREADDQVYDQR